MSVRIARDENLTSTIPANWKTILTGDNADTFHTNGFDPGK